MKYVDVEVNADVEIEVKDRDGNELDCEVDSFGDEITVRVNIKPADLSQFTAELLLRHPEMRPEIEQIINEINLKNNLVKP